MNSITIPLLFLLVDIIILIVVIHFYQKYIENGWKTLSEKKHNIIVKEKYIKEGRKGQRRFVIYTELGVKNTEKKIKKQVTGEMYPCLTVGNYQVATRGWMLTNIKEEQFDVKVIAKHIKGPRKGAGRENFVSLTLEDGYKMEMRATNEIYPYITLGKNKISVKGCMIVNIEKGQAEKDENKPDETWKELPVERFEVMIQDKRTQFMGGQNQNIVDLIDSTGRAVEMYATDEIYPVIVKGRSQILAQGPMIVDIEEGEFLVTVVDKRTNGLHKEGRRENYVSLLSENGVKAEMYVTDKIYPFIKNGRARIVVQGQLIIDYDEIGENK